MPRRRNPSWIALTIFIVGSCLTIKFLTTATQQATAQTAISRPPRAPADARPAGGQSAKSDIAAVVNGYPITQEMLGKECLRRFGEEVLASEINKRLILQACQAKKIQVTAADIEKEVANVSSRFRLPPDKWITMLQEERNISPEQYKRDIIWPTLALKKLAAEQLEIAPEELQETFDSQYGPKVQVRMIATQSEAKARQLHAQLMTDPSRFEAIAKDESEDENSAAARGLIPPIRRHIGEPIVEQAAFALQEGQISPVVAVAGQFLIFRCERHLPATELEAEAKRDVLAHMQLDLADRKLHDAAGKMFKQLQDQAKIINVMNNPQAQQKSPGVAATINGQPIAIQELTDQCLLRHGNDVLEGEVNRALLTQELQRQSITVSQSDLDAEIARAAVSFGFRTSDGQPDVEKWLANVTKESQATVDTYIRDAVWPTVALKKMVDSQVQVSDEDIEKGFRANYGERVEVLAVVVNNQRTAHEVFDLARANPTDDFFGQLAQQYSIEPISRANLGRVPPIRLYSGQPVVEKEAFRLQPGEISGVIAIGDKFAVLRCLGRTDPVVSDIEAVRDELISDVREKKMRLAMNEQFDRLKEAAQIDNFLAKTTQQGDGQVSPVNFER